MALIKHFKSEMSKRPIEKLKVLFACEGLVTFFSKNHFHAPHQLFVKKRHFFSKHSFIKFYGVDKTFQE